MLDAKIPKGSLPNKWTDYKSSIPLVSPANKKKLNIWNYYDSNGLESIKLAF